MATAAAPTTGQRFLLNDVSWGFYEHLLDELGDRRVRVTYDRGKLELMAPSYRHENYARTLGRFVMVLCEELGIPVKDGGSTTFRSEDLDRGLESDDCFFIQNVDKILGKRTIDLEIDPPPDLAIEIDITRSSIDRMGIYAALRVREVWRFDGRDLRVYCLNAGGEYDETEESAAFPTLPFDRVVEFLLQSNDLDDATLNRKFRDWVRKHLVRRKKR